MTWTLVQKTASVITASAGTVTGTLPGASTAGNLLVAFLGSGNGGNAFTGPAGWTQGPAIGNGSVSRAEIWYYPANPGSISSAVFTSGTGAVRCVLAEFHTDVAGAMVSLDFSGTGTAGAVTSVTATASASSGDLACFACLEHFNTPQALTWTDPSGFTLAASMTASANNCVYSAYDLSTSSGSLSVTGTSNVAGSGPNTWSAAVATFKVTTAGSAPLLVGASISTGGNTPFPTQNQEQARALFQSWTGRPVQVRRVYFGPGTTAWPINANGSVNLGDEDVNGAIAAGIKCVVSFKPAFNPPSQAHYDNIVTVLTAYQNAGLNADVGLWHEPSNPNDHLSPAQFAAMSTFYAPAITPFFPFVYIGTYWSAAGDPQQYTSYLNACPAGTFSKALIDFYCDPWKKGATLDGAAAACDALGISLGLGEWGCSITNDGLTNCTNYFTYITNFFNARKALGTAGDLIWFNNGTNGLQIQAFASGTDKRIPSWQTMFDTLTSGGSGTVAIGASLKVAATPSAAITGATVQVPSPPSTGASGPPGFPVLIGEIGVVPTAPQPTAGTFLLGDPSFGLLNFDVLGASTNWADVTTYVKSFTTTRTSTRQNAPVISYDPGTLSVVLDNTTGNFDPDNPNSPYVSGGVTQIHPMTPARISAVWEGITYRLFSGFADSWITPDTNYGPYTQEMDLAATDGFKVLQGFQLAAAAAALTPTNGQLGPGDDTGTRISRLLDLAGWSNDDRVIDTGNTMLQGTTLQSSDALTEMQLSTDTELGELYVNGAGQVVFRRRHGVMEDTRSNIPQAVFSDNPASGALPYTGLGRSNDDTQLCNDAQITAAGSANLQEATDTASITRFLYERSYQRSDLLLLSDAEALEWAQFIVYLSKGAEDRFDTITLSPLRDPRLWPHALGREIGDMITVTRTPPNTPPITKNLIIRGITHTVAVSPASWQTQWILQDASRYSFLTLDQAALGQLDSNALAY